MHRVGDLFAIGGLTNGGLFDKFLRVHMILKLHLLHFVAIFHGLGFVYFRHDGLDTLLNFEDLARFYLELSLGLLRGPPLSKCLRLDWHR